MRARAIGAMSSLAGVVLPWAVVLAVVGTDPVHAHPHARPTHPHEDLADIAFHGHPHDAETPPHDHVLLVAKAARPATRVTAVPCVAGPFRSMAEPPAMTHGGAGFVPGPSKSPPVPFPGSTVLRI